jgi:hypothetical protein
MATKIWRRIDASMMTENDEDDEGDEMWPLVARQRQEKRRDSLTMTATGSCSELDI